MTLQKLLVAFATFRQNVQPEWFAHIHSHGHATAKLARSFAATCLNGITDSTLDEIEFGANMHDIGKYLIPREILFKDGSLTADERTIINRHPVHGAEILDGLPYITQQIIQCVLYHHERWDGSGYPEGLAGNAIPFVARVVAVADVYTSLRARRSYKVALSRSGACKALHAMAGNELDPNLVHDFLRLIRGDASIRIARSPDSQTRTHIMMRQVFRILIG